MNMDMWAYELYDGGCFISSESGYRTQDEAERAGYDAASFMSLRAPCVTTSQYFDRDRDE